MSRVTYSSDWVRLHTNFIMCFCETNCEIIRKNLPRPGAGERQLRTKVIKTIDAILTGLREPPWCKCSVKVETARYS
jgi:hypothetical protein